MHAVHKTLLVTLILNGTLLSPGMATAGSDVLTDAAPPPPRAEHEPPHRDGYVWAPGHWEWTGRFYRWISGSYISERRGAHWVADHWDPAGNQWHYVPGHWER